MTVIPSLEGVTNPDVVQTLALPVGLASVLPKVASVEREPEFAFLTGLHASAGQQHPSTACGNCIAVNTEFTCRATLPFGRVCFSSGNITVEDVVAKLNRGEADFRLIGDLVGDDVLQDLRTRRFSNARNALEAGVALKMREVAAAISAEIATQIWQGTGSGNAGYATPVGLEEFILNPDSYITGDTGVDCSSAYPATATVNAMYNSTDSNGSVLVQAMARMAYVLQTRASRTGLAPVEWAICMPAELWYLVANIWVHAFSTTTGYALPAGSTFVVDASALTAAREKVMSDQVLTILGRPYRVITDDGIDVTVTDTTASANIYFIPLRVANRYDATVLQYLDLSRFANWEDTPFIWTDSGQVQWWTTQTGPCFSVSALTQYRPVILTPHLAGAIVGVRWTAGTEPAFPTPVHPGVPLT